MIYKKLGAIVCILALLCSLMFFPVGAADILTGAIGEDLTYVYDEATRIVTISGTGRMNHYIDTPGIPSSSPLKGLPIRMVVVEEGVTSIGHSAFLNCRALEAVILPTTMEHIEMWAFKGCYSLQSMYFMGNAPEQFGTSSVESPEYLTLYYLEDAEGWTTPEWRGFQTAKFSGAPYWDVPHDAWYADDIVAVWEAGLMNGVGTDRFAPQGVVSRAQVVTILYRLNGSPVVSQAQPFTDVPEDSWYTDAVLWAAETGVVTGYPGGPFRPDADLTREQLATILWRAATQMGLDVSARAELGSFPDAASVSDWATEAMQWAVAEGILTGVATDGTAYLKPTGSAQRCQLAAILNRFCEANNLS